MATYKSYRGVTYTVDENKTFGKGGEGTTCAVVGRNSLVAKIYHKPKRTEMQEYKLKAMLNTGIDDDIKKAFAWPIDIIYQPNGEFAGFIMPKVSGIPLNVIYDRYKDMKLSKRITIAKNLCVAVNNLHYTGQVVGDLNPNNMLIVPDFGTVTLIDCDSFHITSSNGRVFRCEVGMPQYISKDLSNKMKGGKDLTSVPLPTFTKESDSWALATHIFQLLMQGAHPFAIAVDYSKRTSSVTCPQPIDNIRKGVFPYYDCPKGFKLPVYAPEFNALSSRLRSLFIDEFSKNINVTPKEWYDALCDFEEHLKKCKYGHEYNKELRKCPYCTANSNLSTALAMPSSVSSGTYSKDSVSSHTVTQALHKPLSRKTFVIISIMVSIAIQALLAKLGAAFYYDNKFLDGMFDSAADIVQKVGPYFNLIIGFITSMVYVHFVKNVKWWHYLLTAVTAVAGFMLAPLIVYLLGYAIPIILIVAVIGFVLSLFA